MKCGLNNDKNGYKGINEYNWECLQTCVENILVKEIQVIQPKVIFTFGSEVENKFRSLAYPGKDYPFIVIGLPHPAGRRRGFKDEYFRHLYFTRILEGLYKAGVYTLDEACDKFRYFLTKAEIVAIQSTS